MKKLFFTILFALIIVGCDRTEDIPDYKIVDGLYEGYFAYQGINYFHVIELDSNRYEEWVGGGVFYQKGWGTATAGTFSYNGDTIWFELDSIINYGARKSLFDSIMMMPGEYIIDYLDHDSLVFEKGEGVSRIIYYTRRCPERTTPCPWEWSNW